MEIIFFLLSHFFLNLHETISFNNLNLVFSTFNETVSNTPAMAVRLPCDQRIHMCQIVAILFDISYSIVFHNSPEQYNHRRRFPFIRFYNNYIILS